MSDIFKMEYTELRNAPHFIFNGQSTRDFHVRNVQIDSGLAKDDFLPDRNLTVERTRYSEKSYLLGYTEEPIKFKIKLLFDEHKFTHHNIAALRKWLHTETFEEFKFDNEEESALNIVMYAMVTGDSNLTHNVINDGYCELEFTTNSSRKYSEIMEDEYDFSKSAAEKILEEFQVESKATSMFIEKFARQIKQYTARTNYANIEETFKDLNNDKLPDGWKIVSGNPSDMTINSKTGKMTFNNVHIRKRINMNNGRNYYVRMNGNGGKFRVHENDYEITDKFVNQFKFRRNLLGHSGTFDLDSSGDGIGEGWTQVGKNGSFSIDKINEVQTIEDNGRLSTQVNLLKGNKYILIAMTPSYNSYVKIQDVEYSDDYSKAVYIPFTANTSDKELVIGSLDGKTAQFKYIRLYRVTDKEYEDILSQKALGDNLAYDYDYSTNNNPSYQTLVNTKEKFSLTNRDIWKVTILDTNGGIPNKLYPNINIPLKPGQNVTVSLWVQEGTSNSKDGAKPIIRLHDYYNSTGVITSTSLDTNDEWQRYELNYTNTSNELKYISPLFYAKRGNNNVTYFTSPQIEYSSVSTEWRETPDLILDNWFPYFDSHAYFELNYTGTKGTLDYIDMWELNDLNKKKLDNGTPIEDIVYVKYEVFKKWLDTSKSKFDKFQNELMDNFDKLATVPNINFSPLHDKIGILFSQASLVFKALDKGDNLKKYQWDDLQPHYLELMDISEKISEFMKETYEFIVLNQNVIDQSTEIGNNHITVYNFGDKPVYPTFYFESVDGSDIMIKNLDTNEKTIITDNIAGEKIEMIGASEQIYTSRPAPYFKYDAHDDVFIRLKEGYNELELSGNYKMKIVYQFVIL